MNYPEYSANIKTKVCSKCQKTFSCHSGGCWCGDFPAIMPMEEHTGCLCRDCLKEAVKKRIDDYLMNLSPATMDAIRKLGEPAQLVEDIDYYINEQGKFVFTKWYHLRKGFCCGNGCFHCPY